MMWISPDICRGIFPAATPAPRHPHAFAESDSGWHAKFIPVIPVKEDNVRGGEKRRKKLCPQALLFHNAAARVLVLIMQISSRQILVAVCLENKCPFNRSSLE